MKNVLVLMTALLPTIGHADVIKFARNLPNAKVHVLVNGLSKEPLSLESRVSALQGHFSSTQSESQVVVKGSLNDDAPQNPEDMPEGFWDWWRNEICFVFPDVKWDAVVASEGYGAKVAESLDATFLPYDIERSLNPAKGTDIRLNVWNEWSNILPEFKHNLSFKATLFGQESVGKTTLSKLVAEALGGKWLMEYARPYLETVGSELTHAKMHSIYEGQSSLQQMHFQQSSTQSLILDTDLFSTIGYYRILGWDVPEELMHVASHLASNIYYIMPDSDVPFEADELRYGGNQRESSRQFWIDLLEEFNQPYVLVPEGSKEDKVSFMTNDVRTRFDANIEKIRNFIRA